MNPTEPRGCNPGVRNLAISEAVQHLGLYYAPDPSSQIACSIGAMSLKIPEEYIASSMD